MTFSVQFDGAKAKAKLQQIANADGVEEVAIGVVSSARYPDGTLVHDVAIYNEFGTRRMPARPFIRPNRDRILRSAAEIVARDVGTNPHYVVTERAANLIGIAGVAFIQRTIDELISPPNAPSTIARKGSSKPLIDTGQLKLSITHRITK